MSTGKKQLEAGLTALAAFALFTSLTAAATTAVVTGVTFFGLEYLNKRDDKVVAKEFEERFLGGLKEKKKQELVDLIIKNHEGKRYMFKTFLKEHPELLKKNGKPDYNKIIKKYFESKEERKRVNKKINGTLKAQTGFTKIKRFFVPIGIKTVLYYIYNEQKLRLISCHVCENSKPVDEEMRSLWRDHGLLTLEVIQLTKDKEGLGGVVSELQKNQKEIGNKFGEYLGKEVGEAVYGLLWEHIQLAKGVLDGEKTPEEFTAQGKKLGEELDKLFKTTKAKYPGQMKKHTDLVLALAELYLINKKKYNEKSEEYMEHIEFIADALTADLVKTAVF